MHIRVMWKAMHHEGAHLISEHRASNGLKQGLGKGQPCPDQQAGMMLLPKMLARIHLCHQQMLQAAKTQMLIRRGKDSNAVLIWSISETNLVDVRPL